MAWRGDSWADIVARASSAAPRRALLITERESPEELAARAQRWSFASAHIALGPDGLVLGADMESVVIAFAQLYHVEPVDPWPCLALGWVDRGEACSTVFTPRDADADTFAVTAAAVVTACAERVPRATVSGWLGVPELPWERTDTLPGERAETPEMGSYRMAPAVADPIVATRTIATGGARLLTWLAARFQRPRRVEPRRIVLTQRFVYVRTRAGQALRVPTSALRAVRRTAEGGDAVYVFGRNTELLLVHQEGCELAKQLDARAQPIRSAAEPVYPGGA